MKTRGAWAAATMPAVIVPSALGADLAAEARARLERADYTRYALLDRGSYDEVKSPDEPELLAALTASEPATTSSCGTIAFTTTGPWS